MMVRLNVQVVICLARTRYCVTMGLFLMLWPDTSWMDSVTSDVVR